MNTTTTYLVPGMSSGHCEAAIIEQLAGLTGVDAVAVDLDAHLVRVTGAQVGDAAVIAAIYEVGYEAVRA